MSPNGLSPETIFAQAIEIESAAERAAFLAAACGNDADLCREVEKLVKDHFRAGKFLEEPAAYLGVPLDQPAGREGPGTVIGPYKLLEQIGEGGFGVVFLAEQTEPVRRKVALKVLKAGMDTRQVVARFEAERQALAIMDHPNIAKVFGGGTTEPVVSGQWPVVSKEQDIASVSATRHWPLATAGRPYFVMELVKGVPITEYCDLNRLTPRERLELFLPVCQAVQHAHQKGIIHRDLKPSNILVRAREDDPPSSGNGSGVRGVPKVIDFGVAKALGQDLTDKTLFTGIAQMIGTPMYMSPEQAGQSGQDVDTRSDVYSLGVVLYELLTGTAPFSKERFKKASYDEIRRIIREEEPPRPSTRLSELGKSQSPRQPVTGSVTTTIESISAQRGTEPAKLTKQVRGELDWIVMKALEKDRNRRYESASGLARDIERFLNHEPVEACPPSLGYRFRKFVRRNRGRVALVAAGLVLATLLAGGLALIARDRAERRARLTLGFEQELDLAESRRREGKWVEAREAVARARAILASGAVDPEQEQRAADLLADLVVAVRLEAIELPRGLKDMNRPSGAPSDSRASRQLGFVRRMDEKGEARRCEADYAAAFRHLGVDVDKLEVATAAERLRARTIRVELAVALDNWAVVRRYKLNTEASRWERLLQISALLDPDGRRNQVREALRRDDGTAVAKLAASEEAKAWPTASIATLGSLLRGGGAPNRALPLLRRAQQQQPGDFWINMELSGCLTMLRPPRYEEALQYAVAAVAVRPQSAVAHHNLGQILMHLDAFARATAAFAEAVRLEPDFAEARAALGTALLRQGKPEEALTALREAVRRRPESARAQTFLGRAYVELKRYDEAIAAHLEAVRLDPDLAFAHDDLGIAYSRKGVFSEAIAAYEQALRLEPDPAETYQNLATMFLGWKDWETAISFYRQALAKRPDFYNAACDLAIAFHGKGDLAAAVQQLKEAARIEPDNFVAYHNLTVMARKNDVKSALWAQRELVRLRPNDAQTHHDLGAALENLGDVKGAMAALHEALRLKPKYKEAYRNISVMLSNSKDFKGAVAAAREAVKIDDNYAEGHASLAHVLSELEPEFWDEALEACKKALALKKDFAEAHSLLGTIYAQKKMFKEAIAAYKKAIEVESDYAPAHYNLGCVYDDTGMFKQAVDSFRDAIRHKPGYWKAYSRLGVAFQENGFLDEAIEELRQAVHHGKDDVLCHKNLAHALRKKGLFEQAVASRREVLRLEPKDAGAHYELGTALLNARRYDEAIAALEEAIRLRPTFAEAHCNTGHALQRQGKFAEALPHFQRGHEVGLKTPGWRYPSEAWVAKCERMAAMDTHFARALYGAARPASAMEQADLAVFGTLEKKLYGVSARWFQEAFAAEPKLVVEPDRNYRLIAACAAARAGTGQGEDARILDAKEQSQLRDQARAWLQGDFDVCAGDLKERDAEKTVLVADRLAHWEKNPHLAAVRDAKHLAKLPEAERKSWVRLWADAADVLKQARSRYVENVLEGALLKGEKAKTREWKMAAGTVFVIDVDSDNFDTFLVVTDAKGRKLAENDDRGPGDLNSRLVFRPTEAGTYRLTITAFGGVGVGPFTLRVRAFETVEK